MRSRTQPSDRLDEAARACWRALAAERARCPRCRGLTLLDPDGRCCLICGWHGWEIASEGPRGAGEVVICGPEVELSE